MIARLLVANRGEIACRVMRTARRMGIATVAVYSDADAEALHVRLADDAVRIGGAAAADSYLNIAAILEAAARAGADAVHPGYGFLSENADFAEACGRAGLAFVGPSPAIIRAMGDKARAKALMRAAGVPVVPGFDGEDQSPQRLATEAARMGFPVLVKAAAGGGGRGMRRVDRADDLPAALEGARREAESAFGNGTLLLERLVENARHIEVQVFGDTHGNIVHLGERDCSSQRRHQKIVEETPSPFIDDAMRSAMTDAAVAAAKAVDYIGAGTVEFIVGADRQFFFLEMNTRLQVEHPVTEMVTGLDLVEWQLRVAAGEALPLQQDEIGFSGHAIEARLCAEDPAAGFAPQTGKVLRWRPEAAERAGIRIDHGLAEGGEVTPFYDPMIAKIIAHGETREEAIGRLRSALADTPVLGVKTNRDFLLELVGGDVFRVGGVTTDMIDAESWDGGAPSDSDFAIAAAILALADGDDWFSSTGLRRCPVTLLGGGERRDCSVQFERGRLAGVEVGETVHDLAGFDPGKVVSARQGRALWLVNDGRIFVFDEPDPLERKSSAGDDRLVVSSVSGLLRHLAVAEGDTVARGDVVAVVEAMKMETTLTAARGGIVMRVGGRAGGQVRAGDVLAEIDHSD